METRKIRHTGAKHPYFAQIQAREKSFADWPLGLKQSRKSMVAAGFFYRGRSDQVNCFYCGVGIKEWMETDDPWVEHKKMVSKLCFPAIK